MNAYLIACGTLFNVTVFATMIAACIGLFTSPEQAYRKHYSKEQVELREREKEAVRRLGLRE